mmetsp:Transcript_2883/g.8308  ORF Transcript_2883/g.8308 Transcript_2883/m.8308 type:complete len:245 (-) Transcript_2883:2377-3111(-)
MAQVINPSAAATGLDTLRLSADGDLGLATIVHGWLAGHARFDLCRHLHEGVLDVGGVLGRSLEEGDGHGVGELLCALRLHLALAGEIALVAHKKLVHVLRSVPVDLMQPGLHVLERLRVGHVVDDDDAVRAAVVAARDCAEALLACRVPDLQLDCLSIQLDRPDLKVNADGGDVRLSVRVVGEAEEQAGLTHATVANQHQLEHIVVLLCHGNFRRLEHLLGRQRVSARTTVTHQGQSPTLREVG